MGAPHATVVHHLCVVSHCCQAEYNMADRRKRVFRGETLYSKAFEDFVDEVFDGDVSELELSDDGDDDYDDIYPDYHVSNEQELNMANEDEDKDRNDSSSERICSSQSTTDRTFWKKTLDFTPLPPAPEHEKQVAVGVNLPPLEYVSKYLPENIFSTLTEYTNRRYLKNTGRELKCTADEMKRFISATVMMSYLCYPRIRMYWAKRTLVEGIAKRICRDRYFTIRNHLKLVDDDEVSLEVKQNNKFWKIQPILETVRNGCRLNPRPTNVSVDEQMIPFWGHSPARQVIKSKPNPCGLKNFVLAATDGLPLDFLFYQGKGDPIVTDNKYENLDVGGKAVAKLTATLPPRVTIYMDRYFTSESLLDKLHSEAECQATGTLQNSRIPKASKLLLDKDMKKNGRGSIDQSVRSDGQVCVVKWFDNRPVIFMSSAEGVNPVDKCRRWCRKEKKYIQVDRPAIVSSNNSNMGGVDFLDRLITYFTIRARTKKWTVRVIMHFIDFAICASWLEYRRDQAVLGTLKKDVLDCLQLREKYEEFLWHTREPEVISDDDPDFENPAPSVQNLELITLLMPFEPKMFYIYQNFLNRLPKIAVGFLDIQRIRHA